MNKVLSSMGLILLTAAMYGSCKKDPTESGLPGVDQAVQGLAQQCGIDLDCKNSVLEGNASISGVASVDAFFQSVLDFRNVADNTGAEIRAQIQAIRGDFGIDPSADLKAGLQAKVSAVVDGGLTIRVDPPRCAVDAQAMIEAQAQCDATVDPGHASVECMGSCEVEASADVSCDASADLECTFTAPSIQCDGECKGSCDAQLTAAASCSGTCTGTCTGKCSAYADQAGTMCAGTCDGMCMGSCKTELMAGASCSGKCEGECKRTNPSGGCSGAVHAECQAKANAMVECRGRCVGDFQPPQASAQCNAHAKAEAKLNVQCTPPQVAIAFKFKAGVDATAKAQFEAGIRNLKVHLPRLLAAVKRADSVADAGEGLTSDAADAVKGAVKAAANAQGSANIRLYFGLRCAVAALDDVAETVGDSSGSLTQALLDAKAVGDGLGM